MLKRLHGLSKASANWIKHALIAATSTPRYSGVAKLAKPLFLGTLFKLFVVANLHRLASSLLMHRLNINRFTLLITLDKFNNLVKYRISYLFCVKVI